MRRFYAWRNLLRLGAGLIVGALLANMPLDQQVRDWYRAKVHADTSGTLAFAAKQFGEEHLIISCSASAVLFGYMAASSPIGAAVGTWGTQMVRALAVVVPPQVVGQRLLGADRPSDKEGLSSHWHFCHSDKGISGHAMLGSLPFLVAAGMSANPVAQTALYACSGMTALSRIDSDSHYLSQALLGWWLAFLAVRVVRASRQANASGNGTPTV